MLPAIISGTIFTFLSSIVGVDNCTNIVNDELAKGGISGQLDLPWYCQEDQLTTTPNPTPENFEVAVKNINRYIEAHPTNQAPVSWFGDKVASVVDWGEEKVAQINSLTNLAFLFVLLIIILMMLMIGSIVFAMVYSLFRCCFWCFPVRKKKKNATPEVSFGDMKKLMAAAQKLSGDGLDKCRKKKKNTDAEHDPMADFARFANDPEAMTTLYKAFSEAQNAEESQCHGTKRAYPDLDSYDTFSVQEISEDQEDIHF
ncbi:hypothetical protein Ddc_16012 [Ditylenchus destructor]|nr:hypothetical protein Ddc_16012 [Ditylenchus destructor]